MSLRHPHRDEDDPVMATSTGPSPTTTDGVAVESPPLVEAHRLRRTSLAPEPALTERQLECLAALAFAVGSPLQREAALSSLGMDQLRAVATTSPSVLSGHGGGMSAAAEVDVVEVLASSCTHPSLMIAYELLRRGVDPDRIVALIQSR